MITGGYETPERSNRFKCLYHPSAQPKQLLDSPVLAPDERVELAGPIGVSRRAKVKLQIEGNGRTLATILDFLLACSLQRPWLRGTLKLRFETVIGEAVATQFRQCVWPYEHLASSCCDRLPF
jgi:hypothetical protein